MAVASLAYLPMLVLVLFRELAWSGGQVILDASVVFNLPALGLLEIIKSYHASHAVERLSALLLMLSWASLVAWVLWKMVGTFQGDDDPEGQRGRFDWVGFQVRFVIGFVIGFLLGWRFVKYSTSMTTVLMASLVCGSFCGLVYGLSRPPNFWSRP